MKTTSKDSRNVIGSQAPVAGRSLSVSPAGPTPAPSGQRPAPVSRSRSQVKGRVLLMQGIYGPTYYDSSSPPVLATYWASKLAFRLAALGSEEYDLTWKQVGTGSKGSMPRLVPSMRRSLETGSGGERRESTNVPAVVWPTPDAAIAQMTEDVGTWSERRARIKAEKKNGNGMGTPLAMQARLATSVWPTPTTPSGGQRNPEGTTASGKRPDGRKATVTLQNVAAGARTALVAAWPTPRSSPNENRNTQSAPTLGTTLGTTLAGIAQDLRASAWATPAPRNHRTTNSPESQSRCNSGRGTRRGQQLPNQVADLLRTTGTLPSSSAPTATDSTGVLNPVLSSWLQGFPDSWLLHAPTALQMSLRRKGLDG